jgi:hypothetical protein
MSAKISLLVSVALVTGGIAIGCKPAKKSANPVASPPAKVITENDLTTVLLSPQAEQRLGIVVAPVEKQNRTRRRNLGGELLVPLGGSRASTNAESSFYAIAPVLSQTDLAHLAEAQVDADGQIAAAQIQANAAKVALLRAESLLANKSGTQRVVDEMRAQAQLAEAALQTGQERRRLLGEPVLSSLREKPLWVRVPVYSGDLDQIHLEGAARVSTLGRHTNQEILLAKPLAIPFSPARASASVDLFYELERADKRLWAGQKVTVAVPLRAEEESLVVPAAAVVYDIHGGTWIYANSAPHRFTRLRVEVHYVSGGEAVLARGPQPGTQVVTAGVAELFGTEFGTGK